MLKRWLVYLAAVLAGLGLVGALLVAFVFALLYPTLPSLETLTDYQPKIPLKIVSAEGAILGEFGEERRAIVKIKEVPDVMRRAILAAEDERFYQHGGVDYLSVLRAALANLSGGAPQGAGTITMQVARNFFLTRERTLTRKLREVMLAYKIESNLSKDEILELYINQIFLGQRAYGFAAAAQIYFGKPLQELSIAEAAMLAGLPKAPSAYNPVANPKRARGRQLYVLRRMHELHYISDDQFVVAQNTPLAVHQTLQEYDTHAQFAAEMARQIVIEGYGEEGYTRGLTVYTTLRKDDQAAAYAAVRRGVVDYDRRLPRPRGLYQPSHRPVRARRCARHRLPGCQRRRQPRGGDCPGGIARVGQSRAQRRRHPGHQRRGPEVRCACAFRQGSGRQPDPARRANSCRQR